MAFFLPLLAAVTRSGSGEWRGDWGKGKRVLPEYAEVSVSCMFDSGSFHIWHGLWISYGKRQVTGRLVHNEVPF
jgi:hypothetical protein